MNYDNFLKQGEKMVDNLKLKFNGVRHQKP